MAKRVLHPTLAKRAAAVKAGHAHLSANHPGFSNLKPHEQFKAVQTHIRKTGAC